MIYFIKITFKLRLIIKKFISTFIVSILLIQSTHALSIVKHDPACHLVTMYIPINDKTSMELMQILQDELNKIDTKCNNSAMVYDKITHTLIVDTLSSNSQPIAEFIQKTDRKLMIMTVQTIPIMSNNEKPIRFDSETNNKIIH